MDRLPQAETGTGIPSSGSMSDWPAGFRCTFLAMRRLYGTYPDDAGTTGAI